MATQPHPTPPKPAPSPAPAPPPKPDEDPAAAAPHAIPPEPPVETIADEQRKRSAEIEAMGIDAWKASQDTRSEAEKQPQAVPGVAPSAAEEAGSWSGSTRSTPEARKAQNRTAP